jgi:hypothetical protein
VHSGPNNNVHFVTLIIGITQVIISFDRSTATAVEVSLNTYTRFCPGASFVQHKADRHTLPTSFDQTSPCHAAAVLFSRFIYAAVREARVKPSGA